MVRNVLLIAFMAISLVDIVQSEKGGKRLCKPFLMPVLALFYVAACVDAGIFVDVALVVALLFSAAGDLILLRARTERYLMLGMLAFGVTHVLYILIFLRQTSLSETPLWAYASALVYALACAVVFPRIVPHLKRKLQIAYVLYALVILLMNYASVLRVSTVSRASFLCAFFGALFFLISDNILSFRLFLRKRLPGVMETYLLGQFLIVLASLP